MNAADVCQDVEGIEYHISRSPLEAIDALTKALRKQPLVPAEVLKCGALDAKTEIKDRSRNRKYCAERIGLMAAPVPAGRFPGKLVGEKIMRVFALRGIELNRAKRI
jgi:hypothetical protein